MPIHWNIEPIRIEDEIQLLKRAGKKVTHIIPVIIEQKKSFALVTKYAIVFEDQ